MRRRRKSRKHSKRRRALALLGAAVVAGGAVAELRCRFSGGAWKGPESDHFDGQRFRNLDPVTHSGLAFLRWQARRERGEWPGWREVAPGPAPPPEVAERSTRVTWINHATALIQIDGINILTDPIWSYRCSPVEWAGPRRHRSPGINFGDLPRIDVVFISHDHYDHLDIGTLRRLEARHKPRFLAGLGNRGLLAEAGFDVRVTEMDWWDSVEIGGARLHFVPARHFSARGICDRDRTLWGGLFVSGSGASVYFAGDTGFGSHFEQIRDRFGSPSIALLPIGAFRPRWFMSPVHLDPEDAIKAHRILGAERSIPIHWGTFPLGDDGEREAVELLGRLVEKEGGNGWTILEMGEAIEADTAFEVAG
ncbi:MAG: MBL fold metallo-hydrolase [Acidobacteria bacterium]|nr:MBL fold metallo-hydrolase [Acidobacteriota bacterium]